MKHYDYLNWYSGLCPVCRGATLMTYLGQFCFRPGCEYTKRPGHC
jgi:hypothetical protein